MTRRGRLAAIVAGAAAVASLGVAWLAGGRAPDAERSIASAGSGGELPPPREVVPTAARERADFVGVERCAGCHEAQAAAWRRSTHARAGGAPGPGLVIAPFGRGAIRFANAVVVPRAERGGYEFEVRREGEEPVVLRVDGVVGGGHMLGGGTQAYFTDRPDGSWRLIPFEWSRQRAAWFCNTSSRSGKGWVPIDGSMRLEECGDWPPARALGEHPRLANCQSCHASQARVVLDSIAQGYRTSFTSLAITCESCHGPGKRHVGMAEAGTLGRDADAGFAPLAASDKDASLRVCYQCHALKDQLREGFSSGDPLESFYSTRLPLLGDRPLHPDGRVRTFAYQEGHQYSDCYLNGGMTCVSCHEPHGQGYRTAAGAALPGRLDDGQCTACHRAKGERPEAHTRHAPGRTRCVDCHMAARQEPDTRAAAARAAGAPVPYARFDHTISIPRPAVDSALGLASACAGCHPATSTAELERLIAERWGAVKPLAGPVAAQLRVRDGAPGRDAAPLLLGTADDGGDRHTFARFAGVARFFAAHLVADPTLPAGAGARLRALARSPDVDIRAAALASLHLAEGGSAGTRRTLAAALRDEGERDAALRERWAVMLGFAGDRRAAEGDLAGAVIAYERALEVQPSSARVQLGLGNALRAAGDPARAAAAYRRSLALDPRQPLAWVNLGLAIGEQGDAAGASEALLRAIRLDASEPLAYYNLGNLRLVRGDLAGARELYARAAASDPSIAPAHLQLARVSLLAGDSAAARTHLRRALAFDSADADARALGALLAGRPRGSNP